jgi:hypothetical protein
MLDRLRGRIGGAELRPQTDGAEIPEAGGFKDKLCLRGNVSIQPHC